MRQVFLVRHASHDRLGRVLCGRMPGVHLSAQGRAEAEAMAAVLARRISPYVADSLSEPNCSPLLPLAGRREEVGVGQVEPRRLILPDPHPYPSPQGGGERARLGLSEDNGPVRRTAVHVLSSPQPRAQETAAPIAERLGTTVETSPDLDEIDFGAWTGRPFADLESDPAWAAWNTMRATARPPEGESMGEAQARALDLLDRLGREEGPPAILVSHADTLRAALLGVLGLSLDAYDRLVVAPASWSELALWPGGRRVVSINERVGP